MSAGNAVANARAVFLVDGATGTGVGSGGTPLPTGGTLASATATFTRPADTTAYAAGDVVSNSTSATTLMTLAGAARVSGGSGYIVGARLWTNLKSIVPSIRVHLFNASNPTLSADNAAFQTKYADIGKRIATFDLAVFSTSTDTTNSDVSGATDMALRLPFVAVGGTAIYAVLETLTAFTPSSGESFTLVLYADQN